MITVEKILFLRNVSLFSTMPPEELGALAGIAEEIVFSAEQCIIEEGDMGDTMFLIVEGEVNVHRGGDSLAVLKSQDYFGEMTILDGEPRSASVTALQDCLLLRINQTDFQSIVRRHANVALSIIRTLTRRLREMDAGSKPDQGENTE